MEIIIAILIGLLVLLLTSHVLGYFIWKLNKIFFFLNWVMWVVYNPLRPFLKNKDSSFGHVVFKFLSITLIVPIYWILAHAVLTPLRAINALYFDVLLYWSVMLRDGLQELFNPMIGKYRQQRGKRYLFHWVYAFPYRLIRFLLSSLFTIADSFFMFGVSVVFPTLTMYHGTRFDGVLTDIAQKGTWVVGGGDYVGTGVYFGIQKKVASHYANSSSGSGDKGIIVVRFTPTFTRNVVTLPQKLRNYIGSDGQALTQEIPSFWHTTEHWRDDMGGWWEYCLLQRAGIGTRVKTWRIRPVVLLRETNGKEAPHRLWGGMCHYSYMPTAWFFGLVSWGIILMVTANNV